MPRCPDARYHGDDGAGIPWPFTTVQLAAFLGLSRPHLSTILNRPGAEGKARIEGRTLVMPGVTRAAETGHRRPG